MKTIGERIKHIRKSAGLTQQKFADTIGLKQNTVATFEMGKTSPSDRTIADICREFGVDRVWLETGAGEPFKERPRSEQIADILSKAVTDDDSRSRLIRAFSMLPDEMYPKMEAILDEIIENLQKERA